MITILLLSDDGSLKAKKIEKNFNSIMITLGISPSSFYDERKVWINGKEYHIYYNPFSAGFSYTHIVAKWYNRFFCGNLLITKYDKIGNLISLRQTDIKSIKDNLIVHGIKQHYIDGVHHFSNFIILNIQ